MKIRRTKQKGLTIVQKFKILRQKKTPFATFLLFLLFVLSLGTTQKTLGLFAQFSILTDSAIAAEFNVVITVPEEFQFEQDEYILEYYFLSDADIRGFRFWVTNNGEVDVLCRPYINNNIIYRVFVAEDACIEFVVKAKESVDFWLAIAPNGLDTNIKDAELFVDIQQVEGG
jgi:hypothetical protein